MKHPVQDEVSRLLLQVNRKINFYDALVMLGGKMREEGEGGGQIIGLSSSVKFSSCRGVIWKPEAFTIYEPGYINK